MNEMLKRTLDARVKYQRQLQDTPDYPEANRECRRMLMEFLNDLDDIIKGYQLSKVSW